MLDALKERKASDEGILNSYLALKALSLDDLMKEIFMFLRVYLKKVRIYMYRVIYRKIPGLVYNLLYKLLKATNPMCCDEAVYDLYQCEEGSKYVSVGGIVNHNCTLALGYGLGSGVKEGAKRGVFPMLRDAGIDVTKEQAKAVHSDFWGMFSRLNAFQRVLQKKVKSAPYLTNPFYTKLNAESYKLLNAYIQSSVSSVMSRTLYLMDQRAPWATYIATIHDEFIYEIPEERLEEFIKIKDEAIAEVSKMAKFKYPLTLGAAYGKNLYEAK